MGEGLVLESGTHSDLIQAGGAYARLVQSQKLREGRERSENIDVLDADASEESERSIEKEIHEEVPLGRQNTGHSLASEVLEQRREAMGENGKEKDHDLFYVFKRMFLIVRDRWKNYFFGAICACRTCFVFRVYSFLTLLFSSQRNGFPCVWGSLRPRNLQFHSHRKRGPPPRWRQGCTLVSKLTKPMNLIVTFFFF
jgi:hypothetical protein